MNGGKKFVFGCESVLQLVLTNFYIHVGVRNGIRSAGVS